MATKSELFDFFLLRVFEIHNSSYFTQPDFEMITDALMRKYQVLFKVNMPNSRDEFYDKSNSEAYNDWMKFRELCRLYMDFDYVKDTNPDTCEN